MFCTTAASVSLVSLPLQTYKEDIRAGFLILLDYYCYYYYCQTIKTLQPFILFTSIYLLFLTFHVCQYILTNNLDLMFIYVQFLIQPPPPTDAFIPVYFLVFRSRSSSPLPSQPRHGPGFTRTRLRCSAALAGGGEAPAARLLLLLRLPSAFNVRQETRSKPVD